MKIVGLTGSMASGKSTVANWFRRRGAEVVEADRIGHDLLHFRSPAYERLIKAFGSDILGKNGRINRKRLGQKVFADPKARQALNSIVHPLLLRGLREKIGAAKRKRGKMLIVVAALIPEWKIAGWFDCVIAVTAPRERRLERLFIAGFTRREARQRMASQLPEREKCRGAKLIIENRGSLSELQKEAGLAWHKLTEGECFRN